MASKNLLDFLNPEQRRILLEDYEVQCAVASAVAKKIRQDGNLTTLKSMLLEGDKQTVETADLVINANDDEYYGVMQDCTTDTQIKVAEMLVDVLKVRFMPFTNEDLIYVGITELIATFATKLEATNHDEKNVNVVLAKLRATATADVAVVKADASKNALNRLIAVLPKPVAEEVNTETGAEEVTTGADMVIE